MRARIWSPPRAHSEPSVTWIMIAVFHQSSGCCSTPEPRVTLLEPKSDQVTFLPQTFHWLPIPLRYKAWVLTIVYLGPAWSTSWLFAPVGHQFPRCSSNTPGWSPLLPHSPTVCSCYSPNLHYAFSKEPLRSLPLISFRLLLKLHFIVHVFPDHPLKNCAMFTLTPPQFNCFLSTPYTLYNFSKP